MTISSLRRGLSSGLVWAAMALLAIMTALVLIQVFSRYVLGSPVAFTEELVRYALIWVSFIAAAYACLHRDHMGLVLLRDRLPQRGRRILILATDVLILALAVLLLGIGGGMLAWESREDISALLGISRGLVYLISPISGALIALVQIVNIVEDVRDHVDSTPMEES
ncbi:TRAP transporter small permease [Brachybacterium hainanense]|uniref:TRAP transporter small permease n=1 Tax=Brachybacterium hainanense TaxID=1541174 RepID=A0ABV6R8T2_9MICO